MSASQLLAIDGPQGAPSADGRRPSFFSHLSDRFDDAVGLVGLVQGEIARHRTGLHGREAGRVDHLQLGIMLPTTFGDLPPVNSAGQPDVGDQNVRDLPLAQCQRLLTIGGVKDLVAFLAQSVDHQFADKWIVLDRKYSHWWLLNTLDNCCKSGTAQP